MALKQYPLVKTFIVAAWLEAILYGIYFCGFWFTVYIYTNSRGRGNTQNRLVFFITIVMFVLATMHVSMNGYRMIVGYTDYASAPGGPVSFLGVLSTWHHIFKDVVFVMQTTLGDTMAVYRVWTVWSRGPRGSLIAFIPFCLLLVNIVSGTMVSVLFATSNPNASIFSTRLTHWITLFFSVAVAQNLITTGLMAVRLWSIDRTSSNVRVGGSIFLPVLRILMESAALYLFVQILLLSFYAVNYNAQFIVLETITPIVGITFGMITLRILLRSQQSSYPSGRPSDGRQPFGSVPLRRIAVNITTQMMDDGVEDKTEGV
ncbi:hypothetical protein K438DRAFT_1973920 [Mycena galopus ATCC 62051]|nr:hypothetical protein K438DRAFT_1973920 [Mycena galopus ATCC 62051]